MKCPMLIIGFLSKEDPEVARKSECGQQECAWWDEADQACCLLTIDRLFTAIGNTLGKLVDTLDPPRYTFRCHYCGLSIETYFLGTGREPDGWTRIEQVDGKYVYMCDRCSG